MTKLLTLVLAMPYFDGLQWHRELGQPFDTSKLDAKVVEKLQTKGFLMTAAAYKARTNPEAAQVQATADATAEQLAAAQERVTMLEAQLEAAESAALQTRVTELEGQVQSLTGEREQLKTTLATTQQQASEAQAQLQATLSQAQERVRTLEALVKPEGEGTPLPGNFVGRGKLAAFGLETYESLRGKSAQQLNAIEGITPEQASKIVELVAAHFTKAE